ncbi:L,D-transpeptidase [Xanthobacter agilis]|uniref:L,D-transpeptidase n=1 Tax=Xanthobacter agilis TaxID=47492 RepID=UPI003726CD4C
MTLRQKLLLAAFGASLFSVPAFAQGAYNSSYGVGATAADDDETGTVQADVPPGSVNGGYAAAPPGYSDPYGRAPSRAGDQVERTEVAPPSGYQQAPSYGAQSASPTYPQSSYPQAAYPQNGASQNGYGQAPAAAPQSAAVNYPQPPYSQPAYQSGAAPQPAPGYAYGNQGGAAPAAPPAGVYSPNAALVPGTQEAPSGPRIEDVDPAEPVPDRFRRQTVDYVTTQPAGTIVIDTPNTYLYFLLGNNKAVRYGIGVGREGFTWAGTERITGKKEWADWRPPTEMIQRQPYLPRFMAGGPGNPLGARTMYLGGTVYRIHGTNEPQTIGKFVSSGCFRMLNNDVEDLYDRAKVGTKVVILPKPTSAVQASAANGGGMPAAGPVATPR